MPAFMMACNRIQIKMEAIYIKEFGMVFVYHSKPLFNNAPPAKKSGREEKNEATTTTQQVK